MASTWMQPAAAWLVIMLVVQLTSGLEEDIKWRIDCFSEGESPMETLTQTLCEDRGCIYDDTDPPDLSGAPQCYVPQDGTGTGFKVVPGPEDTTLGQRWHLERKTELGIYADNIESVTFEVEKLSDHLLRFKFDATDDPERYKVPMELNLPTDGPASDPLYSVEVVEDPFSLKVTRQSTGTVLWDMTVGGFAFSDQFLQMATRLPSENIYGFGENSHASFKHNLTYQTWPLFARDQGPGHDKEYNLYSVHPFYECIEDGNNAHGVFLLNSNAMDYSLTPGPMLVYKTTGGILDFYMFLGPTAENVVQQYTGVIGRPYMPPYWALGFQLCRYGYKDLNDMKTAVNRTLSYDIPLDVVYADIDYMDRRRIFTIDPIMFGGLPEYFDELKDNNMRTIIILDPIIEINDTTYEPYTDGIEKDVFIKWPNQESVPPDDFEEHGLDMMGYVWPDWKVLFPDFFMAETAEWWENHVVSFSEKLHFDGIWLDMNEPANFDTNKVPIWNWPYGEPYWTLNCTPSKWDDPPYRPKSAYQFDWDGWKDRLSGKTICMQALQQDGALKHYDVHNLYGWKQTEVTLPIMRKAVGDSKRGMLVTRSSYAGSGAHSGRWLGDNNSVWPDLHRSIIGMLEFNLFGFPYIGADICGFFQNTTAEMCKRWQELGAFYPYSRNHNSKDAHDQDPGYFGDYVASPTRETLNIRYTMLPYLYTLFHRAHSRGDTVVRPLMHEFQQDANTYNTDRQFLWGPAFLISPILDEQATELTFYLPSGRWYDYYTGALASKQGTQTITVNDDTKIQLHMRGGYIMPTQEPATNTFFSRQNPFGLKVLLDDQNGKAEGGLFWDDGETIDTYENDNYYFAVFSCENNSLTLTVEKQYAGLTLPHLDLVEIYGVDSVDKVLINEEETENFEYDDANSVLTVTSMGLNMGSNAAITWTLRTSSASCIGHSWIAVGLLFLSATLL